MVLGLGYGDLLVVAVVAAVLVGECETKEREKRDFQSVRRPDARGRPTFSQPPPPPIPLETFSGPNDVPRVARLAGRATGRAVSLVSRFRERAVDLAGASEAGKLAADLSRASRALEAVGADLRGGVSLRGGGGGRGSRAGGAGAGAAMTPSFAASPLVAASPSAGGTQSVQVLAISAEAVRSAQRAAGGGGGDSSSSSSSSPASSYSRSVVTGSDVAAAAIEEEAVSEMAARFLGTGQQQQQQWQQQLERSKPGQ